MLSTAWPKTPADSLDDALERVVARTHDVLKQRQAPDGHWVYELEADATIPSEYIMLEHYLGEIDAPLEQKIARYLRDTQATHGGWPLFYNGDLDLSCSVKA